MWRSSRSSLIWMQIRGLATRKVNNKPEPKFTQSAAFQGRGSLKLPAFNNNYHDTDAHANKKVLSALGSILALVVYFGWLREPSDLDEIWNTPPHILTSNLERKMLREQIKQAQEKGMDTALLQAQLEYVDVKEEALRIQFEQKTRQEERRKQN